MYEVSDQISMDFVNSKYCKNCNSYKQKSEFDKMKKSKDGLQNRCKDCNRKTLREHMNKKYQDPQFYEIQKLRNRLSQVNNGAESRTLGELIGISYDLFHEWLEYQRNGVKIQDEQLDHVLPVVKYGSYQLCWEWINFRPLSREENIRKRDSVDLELYKVQLIKAKSFIDKLITEGKIDYYTYIELHNTLIKRAAIFCLINGGDSQYS